MPRAATTRPGIDRDDACLSSSVAKASLDFATVQRLIERCRLPLVNEKVTQAKLAEAFDAAGFHSRVNVRSAGGSNLDRRRQF
jgi:hypothetical protein